MNLTNKDAFISHLYICQGSRLSFGSFSLKIESDSGNLKVISGRGRRMGRVPLGASEVSISTNSITHGEDFSGKLAYVEIVGELEGKKNSGSDAGSGWF